MESCQSTRSAVKPHGALRKVLQLSPHGLLDIWDLIALFCVRMNYMLRSGDLQGLTILHFIIRSTQSFARVRHLSSS